MTTHDAGSPRGGGPDDGSLARRAASGDRAALAAIFDRYGPRVLALCRGMLRREADAEDCLQDVFVIAATRLSGLREPDRLRSWLFAVARHECLARIEKGARKVPVDTVPDSPTADRDQPASEALAAELAEVVHAAESGLSPRDRMALELADRQGLATDELAAAMGMSASSAYKLLVRARGTARRSLGALLVARTARADCERLALLLSDWDGRLTQLVRKRIARHIEECDTCTERERRLLDPAVLFGGVPAVVVPFRLRSHVLTAADRALRSGTPAATSGRWRHGWPPDTSGVRVSRRVVGLGSVAAAVVVLLALAGVVVAHRHDDGAPVAERAVETPTTTGSSSADVQPTTAPTAARTRRTSTTVVAPPTIESVSATCVRTSDGRTTVVRLTWVTAHDTGVTVSVGAPANQTAHGNYGSTGSADLPSAGCTPTAAAPTVAAPTYTITTVGGTGPAATRTVSLNRTPGTTTTTDTTPTTTAPTTSTSAVVIG